jgi:hypothetical protein
MVVVTAAPGGVVIDAEVVTGLDGATSVGFSPASDEGAVLLVVLEDAVATLGPAPPHAAAVQTSRARADRERDRDVTAHHSGARCPFRGIFRLGQVRRPCPTAQT